MRILVHYDNGKSIYWLAKGTVDDIVREYLDKNEIFPDENYNALFATARSIEFLDPVRIPWGKGGIYRNVTRIHSLSDKYMARNQIHSRIRVDFTIYNPNTDCRATSSCAYIPGMFSQEQTNGVCAKPSTVI